MRSPMCSVVGALLVVVLSGCGDRQPPQWNSDDVVAVTEVTTTGIRWTWAEAVDQRGVVAYRVTVDAQLLGHRAVDDERTADATGLEEFSEHTITVVAVDEAGNESIPATRTTRTLDMTPPAWTDGCEVTVGPEETRDLTAGVRLSWCEVTDNDRVETFTIHIDGAERATAGPDDRSVVVRGEPVKGRWVLQACDPSGNCSQGRSLDVDEHGEEITLERVLAESLGVLGALGAMDFDSSLWGGGLGDVGRSSFFDSLDESDYAMGYGIGVGIASRGSGLGGGGGGAGIGSLGGLETIGGGSVTSYTAPSVGIAGGPPELAAHVQRRSSRVERCYTTALSAGSGLSGTLWVSMSADAAGAVTVGGVSGAGDEALHTCVTNALRGTLQQAPGAPVEGAVGVNLDPGSR